MKFPWKMLSEKQPNLVWQFGRFNKAHLIVMMQHVSHRKSNKCSQHKKCLNHQTEFDVLFSSVVLLGIILKIPLLECSNV